MKPSPIFPRLPAEAIELIDSYCKQRVQDSATAPRGQRAALVGPLGRSGFRGSRGPCYGLLAALHALARERGVVGAVGQATRLQRLALFLIYARLGHQGSRLSAARWSEDQAVGEVLQVGHFDEDDLYAALEYLDQNQSRIEMALATSRRAGPASPCFSMM